MKAAVRTKMWVLYNMHILRKQGHKRDKREKRVREILLTAKTEIQLDNMVHDLVAGNISMNVWLEKKERELNAVQTAAG